MKIVCDACSAKYSIADDKVRGKVFKIRCKKCSNIIVVRGTSEGQPPQQFDNKETRVFDYGGYDEPGAAPAVDGGGSEAVWHLVIDQEQVGPMTAAEIRQRFARGEIEAETYTWREGFADWAPLTQVEDFADLGGAAAAPAPAAPPDEDPVVGMFGGAPIEDNQTARSDPADLFSSAAGDPGDDAGADLFGGGGLGGEQQVAGSGGAPMADSLFGAADDHDEPMGGMDAAAEQRLRGQRNENSVLFSLNNLAALASESPKSAPAPSAPSSSGSSAGMAQATGQEGSGLIDIRSMAQVYLSEKGGGSPSAGTGSVDDLPSFGASSFDAGPAVLLPSSNNSSGPSKIMYALIGGIGLLSIVAIALVVVLLTGDDDKAATNVATNTTGEASGGDKDGDAEGDKSAAAGLDERAESDKDEDADKDADEEADKDADAEAAAAAEADKKDPDTKTASKSSSTKSSSSKSSSSKSSSSKRSSSSSSSSTPKRSSSSSSSSGSCMDEVACIMESKPPSCCCKYPSVNCSGSKSSSRSSSSSSSSSSSLPESLTKSDIKGGIGKVRSRVQACGGKHEGKGTVSISVKVAGSGKVSSAGVSKAPNSALGNCVAGAVKAARFKKTQKGGSFTYPFVF